MSHHVMATEKDGFAQAMEKAVSRLAKGNKPQKDDKTDSHRKLDLAKTSTMDVESLNTLVVKMRKFAQMAKVRTIHKLTRAIKKLKSKTGTEPQIAKNTAKAEKLGEEILVIKAAHPDRISKFALSNTLSLNDVCKQKQPSAQLRAITRLAENDKLRAVVKKWRSEHSDWEELSAFMLAKNTGRRYRKRKVKATVVSRELDKALLKETIKKAKKDNSASSNEDSNCAIPSITLQSDSNVSPQSEPGDSESVEIALALPASAGANVGVVQPGAGDEDSSIGDTVDSSNECDPLSVKQDSDDNVGRNDVSVVTGPGPSKTMQLSRDLRSAARRSDTARKPLPNKETDRIREAESNVGGDEASYQQVREAESLAVGEKDGMKAAAPSRAGTATVGDSCPAEMVIARIDLSNACTADGCILVPAAGARVGGSSTPAAAVTAPPKKRSSFFVRDDGSGSSGDEDTADAAAVQESDSEDSDNDYDDDGAYEVFSGKPTASSSFVSSLHGYRGRSDHQGRSSGSVRGRADHISSGRATGSNRPSAANRDSVGKQRFHAAAARGKPRQNNRPVQRGRPPVAALGSGGSKKGPAKASEKLHPSWEASKKRKEMEKMVIQPYAGKRIKFDD